MSTRIDLEPFGSQRIRNSSRSAFLMFLPHHFRLPTAFVLLCVVTNSAIVRADRIVLRSLQIISDRTVTTLNEEGVVLDNGQRLGWHEIEKGSIAADKQTQFDRMLERGESLYRIRQRLTTADYAGVSQPAESLYPHYLSSTSDTAYLVKQAAMWSRLAVGKREQAVEPYLRCIELLRARPVAAKSLPGERGLQFDQVTGLSSELTPVWFDQASAQAILPALFKQISEMARPRPEGAYVYYASLALTAGEHEAAMKALGAIRTDRTDLTELREILRGQHEVVTGKLGESFERMNQNAEKYQAANQPLAWYWLGVGKLQHGSGDKQTALLQLLKIPALTGRQQPELAAAALYRVMDALAAQGDASGSVSVRRELLERYGQTYYAVRAKGNEGTEKSP